MKMAKTTTSKSRTGDDDNRVVQGGELPEDSNGSPLEDVAPEAPSAASQSPAADTDSNSGQLALSFKQIPDGAPYTLAERFLWAVQHPYILRNTTDPGRGSVYAGKYGEIVGRIAKSFGPDFFGLTNLTIESSAMQGQGVYYVSGKIEHNQVPFPVFHKFLQDYLGQEITAEDTAVCLEVATSSSVSLGDEKLRVNFPDLKELDSLFREKFYLPAEAYTFLMAVPNAARRFLSLCLDERFKRMTGEKPPNIIDTETNRAFYRFDENFYENRHKPFIMFEDAFKVRTQYRVKDPKPYFNALDGLTKELERLFPLKK